MAADAAPVQAAQRLRVAIIQLHSPPRRKEENYKKAESYIRRAAAAGADLAILPELVLSATDYSDYKSFVDVNHVYRNRFQGLAKELKINLVPGTLPEYQEDDSGNPLTDKKLVNVAYYIDRTGKIVSAYRKKNVWHSERPHFEKGYDRHTAFDTEFGKAGLLICWDLAFPEAFRELVTQGAKLFLIPSYWLNADSGVAGAARDANSESKFITAAVPTRAFENAAAIVYCNAGGPKSEFFGLSQIALPFTGTTTNFGNEEKMVMSEIDLTILDEAEDVYRYRHDMEKSDWHYAYSYPSK